jgi:hypothetical protein
MSDTLTENMLVSKIVDMWTGWSDRIEPASGSSVGFPDLVLSDRIMGSIPFEVKLGWEPKPGYIQPVGDGLRPAQIRWHTMFARAGHVSGILIGTYDGSIIRYYIVPGRNAVSVNGGLNVMEDPIMMLVDSRKPQSFNRLLLNWIKQEKALAASRSSRD